METKYFKVEENNPDKNIINECAQIIKNGGLVAFPTETVYGLGANALNETSLKKIYKAKGRPSDNPLILHVASMDMAKKYVKNVPDIAYDLAKVFWPGPLTMIFDKKDIVPNAATANLETVAIRMPQSNVALELIKASDVPIAAPSANLSGKPSTTDAKHVLEDLNGKIDAIIDAGKSKIGLESTVLDISSNNKRVLRPGGAPIKELKMLIPDLERAYSVKEGQTPKSPGMKYTHYSPDAKLIVVKGSIDNTVEKINEITKQNSKAGILCSKETVKRYLYGKTVCAGSINNPYEIASNVFECLRLFNKLDVDIIYSEYFDIEPLGDAIMNRLLKAAGFELINV